MHIDRKTLALLAIVPMLLLILALGQSLAFYNPNTIALLLIVFVPTLGLIHRLLAWVEQGAQPPHQRDRRKIDRLLNVLDEHELDLLRERLIYNEDDNASTDGEYESLETLLNQQKPKR